MIASVICSMGIAIFCSKNDNFILQDTLIYILINNMYSPKIQLETYICYLGDTCCHVMLTRVLSNAGLLGPKGVSKVTFNICRYTHT